VLDSERGFTGDFEDSESELDGDDDCFLEDDATGFLVEGVRAGYRGATSIDPSLATTLGVKLSDPFFSNALYSAFFSPGFASAGDRNKSS